VLVLINKDSSFSYFSYHDNINKATNEVVVVLICALDVKYECVLLLLRVRQAQISSGHHWNNKQAARYHQHIHQATSYQ
jgi:hypothetical protein